MARFTIAGKDQEFFALFEEDGANITRSADLLDELMRNWPDQAQLQREILICEQEGDRITHDIIHRLNTTSKGAPIDRQDIYALAGALDDIVDFIEEAGDFMGLYKIEAPMEQALQMTGVLKETCRNVEQALRQLGSLGDLKHYLVEVNRLENEGDRISREAIASLFDGGIDPVVIIRWKDVFDRLEAAIDACEHASHILEGILVRNS